MIGEKHIVYELNFGIMAASNEAKDKEHNKVYWFFKSVQERDSFIDEINKSNKYTAVVPFKCNKIVVFK